MLGVCGRICRKGNSGVCVLRQGGYKGVCGRRQLWVWAWGFVNEQVCVHGDRVCGRAGNLEGNQTFSCLSTEYCG